MFEVLKVLAVGLIGVFAIIILRQTKPEISIFITIAVSIVIVLMLASKLQSVSSYFRSIVELTGVDNSFFAPLIKIIAIGYIAEFGANICQDSGCNSIADKILFSAKIIILIISLPIVTNVIDLVVGLL